MGKKTLVLGASENPNRYSNRAIHSLRGKNHPVVALGKKEGSVEDVKIHKTDQGWDDIDTVTLYLNSNNQKQYYDQILEWRPSRIIFNPGAENPELEKLARDNGIETENACTLVMLSSGHY